MPAPAGTRTHTAAAADGQLYTNLGLHAFWHAVDCQQRFFRSPDDGLPKLIDNVAMIVSRVPVRTDAAGTAWRNRRKIQLAYMLTSEI